jgi:hypothetical protein
MVSSVSFSFASWIGHFTTSLPMTNLFTLRPGSCVPATPRNFEQLIV